MATFGSVRYTARAGILRTLLASVLGVVGALTLGACSREDGKTASNPPPGPAIAPSADKHPRFRVVTTTGMIADSARIIAGPEVEVVALMGPGTDPHLYKPSPADVRALQSADLVLYNGLHLEGKLAEIMESLARTRRVVPVGDAIPPEKLRRDPNGHPDPHIWFDPTLWIYVSDRIASAIAEADASITAKNPAGDPSAKLDADGYAARAADLRRRLTALDVWTRAQIETIPAERRIMVTAHDAFGYFGRAYGIEVLGIQGISTESEAALKDINRLVDTLVSRAIPAVFVESSVPRKTIEALIEGAKSRGHSIAIGGELFSDAMGAANTPEGSYEGMLRHNVQTIVGALAPPTPAPPAKGG